MMNMLLYFFLAHQCISISELNDWYQNDTFVEQILGLKVDKEWAEPFFNRYARQTTPKG